MLARGFLDRWIAWINTLWNSSSSRVCINREVSELFKHKRGLRQGDPLSPMLFNLGVDVFQRMVQVANSLVHAPLSYKLPDSILALQYADDTAVIARANVSALISFKLILRLFALVSGLRVNYSKSSFIPINSEADDLTWIQAILGCTQTNFPISYLGMPLTLKKPTKDLFIPLIEKLEHRLQGWQSKLLSRGGRLILVQSVLSTIPVYYMICFQLPKWVIARLDKARRDFLWGSSKGRGKSIHLCNWNQLCLPKEWGGMAIADLHIWNIALLLRWLWKMYNEPNSMWTQATITIRWQGFYQQGPMLWSKTGSFFWVQLMAIKPIIDWSTT